MSGTNTLGRSRRGVTLTANQLNALVTEATLLDGLTATAAELNALDITAAGTAEASKAVVLGSSKEIATLGTVGAAATTITSASASALAVGLAGATNPSFVVDSSTGSQAAGLKVTGATAAGTVAAAVISSGSDANLTVNAKGTGTIGIGSVSTGAVTITPATTVTGIITPTGGVAAAGGFSASPRGIHTGDQPAVVSTDGNNSTPSITETYVSEVFVPCNMTITGVALFNGSDVTGNVTVGLATSAGAPIAAAKSASTAGSGTDAYQRIPFATPYAAVGPATYYIQVQYSSATARYNTHTLGNHGVLVQTSQSYGTLASFTPPTTFVTAVGNIAALY